MDITQTEIDELRRLHEAATPGDWHYDDGVTDGEGTADAERGNPAWITAKGNVLVAEPSGCAPQEPCVPTLAQMDANGRCIVNSHNALPRLLAALEEAQAKLAKVVASFAAYINSEDEDRVAEWIDLCEAVKAGEVQP